MNSWSGTYYHDAKGKILGSVSEFNGTHKALINNVFIGFYINKESAMNAVEEAFSNQLKENTVYASGTK